jgi:hypothetical protein
MSNMFMGTLTVKGPKSSTAIGRKNYTKKNLGIILLMNVCYLLTLIECTYKTIVLPLNGSTERDYIEVHH